MSAVWLWAVPAWLAGGFVVAVVTRRLAVYEWCHQLFVAVDQVWNVMKAPFHKGQWADETLSACAYRAHRDGKLWGRLWMPPIDVLFFWQERHCERAYIAERERLQAPPEVR